jgi:radical SAM superfamily enzyme YgiQ (UPF0313 family)
MPSPKRIVLVNPPISPDFARIECTFPRLPPVVSLPLLACETERRASLFGKNVLIIQVFDRPSIEDKFFAQIAEADILGLSTWFSNYASGVAIAEAVKAINPSITVVFGGPNAANLGSRALENRPFIDYIVAGDGEDVLWRLAENQKIDVIPNLWYRNSQGVPQFTHTIEIDLDEIAPFDFRHIEHLDLSSYDSRKPEYLYEPAELPISLVWIRGCQKAVSHGRCGYCSIPDKSLRCMSAKNAWAQLEALHNRYGIVSFFEGGDDFTCRDFAEELAACVKSVKGINLRAYCGLWRLTESKLKAFRRIGLSEVFVGLETTIPKINKWSGHSVTRKLIYRTFSLLQQHGIRICMPLLFGLPNESHASLKESENLAYELIERFDNIRMVLVSLAVPLIGSRWFSELMHDPYIRRRYCQGNLATTDIPDYAHLSVLSIQRHCSVSPAEIMDAVHRIKARLAGRVTVGCFGALDNQGDHYRNSQIQDNRA